jgi:flagellar motor switch protein FliM
MSQILTPQEIDALLDAGPRLVPGAGAPATQAAARSAVAYNFLRPDRISKEQIRSLHFLHDRFARNVSMSLSAYLRTLTDVSIVSVEQFAYSEFLMSLPDPTAFYAVSMPPYDVLAALEVNPAVAFAIVDRLLGGTGEPGEIKRSLSEIEQNMIDLVVKLLLENLTETWRSIVDVEFHIQSRETRPQMLKVAAPNEVVILCGFEMKVAGATGRINLCVPASIVELAGDRFTQRWDHKHRGPTAADRLNLHRNLEQVRLRFSAMLATRMTARELAALVPGDVVALDTPAGAPVRILVERAPKFTGRLVRRGARSAVAIQEGMGHGVHSEAEA